MNPSRLLALCLSACLLAGCSTEPDLPPDQPAKPTKKPKPKKGSETDKQAAARAEAERIARREAAELAAQQRGVLVIGDSLSAGEGYASDQAWPGLLKKRLARLETAVPVVDGSISGNDAGGSRSRIGWQLGKYSPRMIVLAVGSRDLARQKDLDQVRADLASVIRTAKSNNVPVLLVGVAAPTSVPEQYRQDAARMFRDLAKAEGVPLVDDLVKPLTRIQAVDPQFVPDTNTDRELQPAILDNLWPTLEGELRRIGVDPTKARDE